MISEIAAMLTKAKIPTIKRGEVWNPSVIASILRNEKYKGEVLMQKTYTVDCFSHTVRKNNGQQQQYYLENHHPAIISRADWDEVESQQSFVVFRNLKSRSRKKALKLRKLKAVCFKDFSSSILDGTKAIRHHS